MTQVYIHIATEEAIERVARMARSHIEHLERQAKLAAYQESTIQDALQVAMAAMRNDCAIADELVREARGRREGAQR